ncbi:MAG: helix-turn-helix domain-containing protein [Acutalibacteraceae bacterium]|nr:helix-turn-helix domain-containing protein [Acutalibacteraceae bacterium]
MTLLELGDRYTKLRESKNLSIAQLSKEINCNQKTISFYENGTREMPRTVLLKYSEFFNVSVDYLLGLSNVKTFNSTIKGVSDFTGLSEDAVVALKVSKDLNEANKTNLINFIATQDIDEIIVGIKEKHKYTNSSETVYFDTNKCEKTVEINIESVYKSYVEVLFWRMVQKYYDEKDVKKWQR